MSNIKGIVVGLGMGASTLLGSCGQKAANQLCNVSSEVKYFEKIPSLVIQKGDTVLNYYHNNDRFIHNAGNKAFNIVGDMITINEKSPSGIGSLKLIARDVKLPDNATQVAVSKGDSIDFVF